MAAPAGAPGAGETAAAGPGCRAGGRRPSGQGQSWPPAEAAACPAPAGAAGAASVSASGGWASGASASGGRSPGPSASGTQAAATALHCFRPGQSSSPRTGAIIRPPAAACRARRRGSGGGKGRQRSRRVGGRKSRGRLRSREQSREAASRAHRRYARPCPGTAAHRSRP